MNKKLIFTAILSGIVMIFIPLLTVDTSQTEEGIASIFTLLFAIDPVYTLAVGIFAGTDRKSLWALPIITAVFFILGFGLIFTFSDIMVYMYGLCYLLTGTLAMFFIDIILRKRRN